VTNRLRGALPLHEAGGTRGLERHDAYDSRRRLIRRAYVATDPTTRATRTVADLRYTYDGADRERTRQDLHRGGRTQRVTYDDASRVLTFDAQAIPEFTGDATRAQWTLDPGLRQGTYTRRLAYDTLGRDHLAQADTLTATAAPAGQAFARGNLQPSAELGFVTRTQAGQRTRDAHGQAHSIPSLLGGTLTLTHDARGRLTRVDRDDGRAVTYTYRPDGILLARDLTCGRTTPSCRPRSTTFVYDGLRLLEQQDDDALLRFFYDDHLDVPFAVDRIDTQGNTTRAFLVTDRQGSLRGLLDPEGRWLEHLDYDLWGWPTRTTPDPNPPEVDTLTTRGGALIVAFTEPVLPAPGTTPGPSGLVGLQPLDTTLRLVDVLTGNPFQGTTRLRARAPGHELVFVPNNPPTPGRRYRLEAQNAPLVDAHGNPVAPGTLATLTWPADNRVLLDRGRGPQATAPLPLAESPFGHLLGFQGHLVDHDLGLIHMRGRVFDPHTGTFLELDPEGLVDSTNPYAGFAHDTVNNRDPTGRIAHLGMAAATGFAFGFGMNLVRQAAELYDAGKPITLESLDVMGAVAAGGPGAIAGVALLACPGCAAALGAVGGIQSAESMGENIAEAKFATAAVDAADAFMGLSGATFGAKKIREGKVAFIAPTAKKVAYQVADKLKAPRTAQAKAPEPVRLSSTTAEPVAPCTGPTCSGGQCFVTGTLVDTPDGLVPIESLRVGDRVVAHDACVDAEITDAWRVLSLRLDDARGPAFAIEVDTLVPPELAAEAEANGRHPLVLTELGVRGLAEVLDIREPPPLTSGPGCLVRSTITSWSARVLTLRFAETDKALEPTEGHPLYRLAAR
jgi:RHS repeat-associated protein